MQVNSSTSSNQASAYSAAQTNKTTTGQVDTAQFMQLLLAQLTHQNPLEPMSNSEMMSQFSQLNSLQELRNINSSMTVVSSANQTTYTASLIGKTIKANGPEGKIIQGVVDGAILEKNNLQLRMGEKLIALSDVIEVIGVAA